MSTERTSLLPSLPWFGEALLPSQGRRDDAFPPAIVAPRGELIDERAGRIRYFSNAVERRTAPRCAALVLVHAPHLGAGAHDMRRLFEQLRDARSVYALDLPGFGHSECAAQIAPSTELYVTAITRMVEHAALTAGTSVDVVAVGLSAEFAAKVAAQHPELVRTLSLIEPSGFSSEHERGLIERAARRGRAPLSLALIERLGLATLLYGGLVTGLSLRWLTQRTRAPARAQALHYMREAARQPGAERAALATLRGALYPRESPQAIYTRVHRPTLILTPAQRSKRFGELARFVKWRDHFSAQQLASLDLNTRAACTELVDALLEFWAGPGRPSRV